MDLPEARKMNSREILRRARNAIRVANRMSGLLPSSKRREFRQALGDLDLLLELGQEELARTDPTTITIHEAVIEEAGIEEEPKKLK
jgi:hypothetical protein